MPVFNKTESSLYLITNYKVMYSTLKHQKKLERINIRKKFKFKIVFNKLYLNKKKFYFIARNPYDKVESFFRDKFRKSSNYFDEKGFWQAPQKIFFPFFDIDESMTSELIRQKLIEISFSDFLSVLPKVYMLDRHLHPQWLKQRVKLRVFGINFNFLIKIKKLFKIESQNDLNELKEIFNIDIKSRFNSTGSVNENIIWTKKDIKTVEELYKNDFKLFDYKFKT